MKILRSFNWFVVVTALLIIAASFYLVFSKIKDLPPEIPLWYSKPWGEQRLARPDWLYLIPSLIIVTFAINKTVASLLESKVLVNIITWSTIVFGVIISYSLLRILVLVG